MNTTNPWLSRFFWFTFGAFLAPSIPHIAFFFHAWEPQDSSNIVSFVFWWLVSYAIAFSIDGTVIWLTKTAVIAVREQAPAGYKFWLWTFIAFLTVLSFQINQWYAIHNIAQARVTLSGAIDEHLSLHWFTLSASDLMPVVASLFPVLAIMFMVMADKVTGAKPVAEKVEDYSDEEFAKRMRRIQQEKALKDAAQGKSLLETAHARVIGRGTASKAAAVIPVVPLVEAPEEIVKEQDEDEPGTADLPQHEQDEETDQEQDVSTPQETESEQVKEQERDTGELETVDTPGTGTSNKSTRSNVTRLSTKSATSDGAKRVKRIIKRYPDATDLEIATKAQVSRSYVNRIRRSLVEETIAS